MISISSGGKLLTLQISCITKICDVLECKRPGHSFPYMVSPDLYLTRCSSSHGRVEVFPLESFDSTTLCGALQRFYRGTYISQHVQRLKKQSYMETPLPKFSTPTGLFISAIVRGGGGFSWKRGLRRCECFEIPKRKTWALVDSLMRGVMIELLSTYKCMWRR